MWTLRWLGFFGMSWLKFIFQVLRKTLDDAGYSSVEIVAADGNWAIAHDVLRNSSLRRAMSIIGWVLP